VNGLSPEHFANWMSLYAATGVCAMIAAFGAALSIGVEVVRAREWLEVRSFGSAALSDRDPRHSRDHYLLRREHELVVPIKISIRPRA
jgi:hypothetical protein